MKIRVTLKACEEECGFTATAPGLPGCVSEGDTREEALQNLKEAIALFFEDCGEECDGETAEIEL